MQGQQSVVSAPWDELVQRYRLLGGVAENVRLGSGAFGRGIFVEDPSRPARVHSPMNLCIPIEALGLRDGRLTVLPGVVGEAEGAFFEFYEERFGWGAGGYEEALAAQTAWASLPADVIGFIKTMGVLDHPEERFLPASDATAFHHYLKSRDFGINGRLYAVPLVDLVNHSSAADTYVLRDGAGVRGTFADEVLVRYNIGDTIAHALNYNFTDRAIFAYSIGVTLGLPNGRTIVVRRSIEESDVRNGILYPRVQEHDGTITLQNLMLGFAGGPDLPRAIFRKILREYASDAQADDVFDVVMRFNRQKFIDWLRLFRTHDGPLVRMLQDAAINHLETLSACVGARAIAD